MLSLLRSRLSVVLLVGAFMVAITLGFLFTLHRYQLLDGNNIDYSYFLQFTYKAFSPTLVHEMSITPYGRGENMLFTAGFDSGPSIWHWMHIEPIKIIPAFLYALTGSILASYAFHVVFFYLPLLYGAYILWRRREQNIALALALIAAATFFATLFNATDYLRPWPLLMPLFLCLVLSLAYRRPLVEKIAFLTLFLIVREEAMILAAAALVWELLRNRRTIAPQRDTWVLWGTWAGYVALAVLYLAWTGYEIALPYPAHILLPSLFGATCVSLAFLWWLWRQGTLLPRFVPELLFAIGAFVPIIVCILWVDPHAKLLGYRLIYSRYGIFLFYIAIGIFIAYIQDRHLSGVQKKICVVTLSACIALFALYEVLPHPSATLSYVARWDAQAEDDALVYRASHAIPYDSPVLLDKVTIVAFADHDNTYAYNYLPAKLASTTGPTFPENLGPLRALIATHIPFAVLAKSDAEPLLKLIVESGQTPVVLDENSRYVFYVFK